MSLMQREKEAQLDRELSEKFDNWKNMNLRWLEEHAAKREVEINYPLWIGGTLCAMAVLALLIWRAA